MKKLLVLLFLQTTTLVYASEFEADSSLEFKGDSSLIDPFHRAIVRGNKELVEEMLEENETLAHALDKDFISSFAWAIIGNKEDIAKLLLEKRANINGDFRAKSPLLAAYETSSYQMVLFLIEQGAVTRGLETHIQGRNKDPKTQGPSVEFFKEQIRLKQQKPSN